MKTKLVLWGTDSQDKRVLIGLQLLPDTNMVKVYVFPENVATEEFSQILLKDWRNDVAVDFPEEHTLVERELSVTEGLLPDDIKVERGDIVQRAQTEWHFIVLSAKLNDSYQTELSGLRERVDKLENYDGDVWNALKTFWEKVQGQVRERNLFREHANSLRDNTNALFSKMKELRVKLDDEFQKRSGENHDKFLSTLENIENRISEGLRLQPIFEELKDLQRKFRDTKLTREHRSKVWERLDNAFKIVKQKRFGSGAAEDKSPMERLTRRYNGLIAAIEKMERSIQRDRDDLEFQNRKIEASDGQLESQIRQAKIKMIQERISSKENKLGEMMQTKEELDRRIEAQKEKDAKREERERLEEAKRLAQEKIKSQIEEKAAARQEEGDKFVKAAGALGVNKDGEEEGEAGEEGIVEKGEAVVEKAVDKAKDVAEKAEEAVEQAVEKAEELAEQAEEKIEETVEQIKESTAVKKAKELAEQAEEKIEEAVEQIKDGTAVKKAKELAEQAEEKIEETVEQIKDGTAVKKAKELVEQAEEKIEETVEQIKDGTAVKKAKELVEQAEEKVEQLVEDIKDGSVTEKVEDAIEDGIDTVKAVASVIGGKIGDAVDGLKDKLKSEEEEE